MGWWRGIAYGPLAWYPVDDLIAEIRFVFTLCCYGGQKYNVFTYSFRESVSNNRIKSGYENRTRAPIDLVPAAGARAGTADGTEITEPGLAPQAESLDALEEGQLSPLSLSRTSSHLTVQSQIPPLQV